MYYSCIVYSFVTLDDCLSFLVTMYYEPITNDCEKEIAHKTFHASVRMDINNELLCFICQLENSKVFFPLVDQNCT